MNWIEQCAIRERLGMDELGSCGDTEKGMDWEEFRRKNGQDDQRQGENVHRLWKCGLLKTER
jgi:hypothetical protein